jgi:hypothetical protein
MRTSAWRYRRAPRGLDPVAQEKRAGFRRVKAARHHSAEPRARSFSGRTDERRPKLGVGEDTLPGIYEGVQL